MEDIKEKLVNVIKMTGLNINNDQLHIKDLGIPHKPTGLPKGKMGIYAFSYNNRFLKIGKVGQNSNARFQSQHYKPNSSQSNLAKSILNDAMFDSKNLNEDNVGDWIQNNVRRIDFIIDASLGIFVLNLIESFLHCYYEPVYEGYKNQR